MKFNLLSLASVFAAALLAAGIAHAADFDDQGHRIHNAPGQTGCMHKHHPHQGGPFAALSQDDRKALHDAMEAAREQNKPLHEKMRSLHEDLHALLTAPTFDKNAYLAKKHKLDALEARAKATMENAFASAIAQFTPEERKALAKFHEMRHHHPKWKHDGWSHQHEEEPYHQPETD